MLRVIFMGTPDFAVPALHEIAGAGHEIAAVYTRAPKPAGRRGLEMQDTPVAREAKRLGIPVLTPSTLKTPAALAAFRAFNADVAVVVAYGMILPKDILGAPVLGCFNLHASLLPRWRGAAPIHRAIMAGDKETGVMVMKMDEGLDTGPVAMAERVAISPDMTTGDLHDDLARIGARMMPVALAALERGSLTLTPQAEAGVTYATKLDKNETRIDWSKSAQQVHDHIRGLSPFPGAWFEMDADGNPIRVKALRSAKAGGSGAPSIALDDAFSIACGDGAVRVLELQRAGGKAMKAEEFLRGTPLKRGARLR